MASSEGYTCLFLVSCIVWLTSDLLPSISLVIGQSSVNLSLALCAREISTPRRTSNSDLLPNISPMGVRRGVVYWATNHC